MKKAQESAQGFTLSSLLTDLDFKALSGQLKDIAGYIETFNQFKELFRQADVSVPKQDKAKGESFNLINMLKDKDSLNHLLQMFSNTIEEPGMNTPSEKKVEPINVEDHHTEDK
ncbi:MAG: hypothetical protein AAGU27_15010 [Dehalobacterium sp.]